MGIGPLEGEKRERMGQKKFLLNSLKDGNYMFQKA